VLLKDHFFLFELGCLVSADSSILTLWVNQDASQSLMLLLFRPGSHWTRQCFSSLGSMNRLPIHGTQGPGNRVAPQDTAGAWTRRSSSPVLPVTPEEVHVPELLQTSQTQQATKLPEE